MSIRDRIPLAAYGFKNCMRAATSVMKRSGKSVAIDGQGLP